MLICEQCGGHNAEDVQFCGACGAFLEWTASAAPDKPPAEPEATATVTPQVVQPGETVPVRRRPAPQPVEERAPAAGELVCGQCGAGNDPDRRFCRRCGRSLLGAVAIRRPPWWRRLFGLPYRRARYAAGERRGSRRRPRVPRVMWVVVLGLLAAAVFFALPGQRLASQAVTAARDRLSAHVPARPEAVRASSTAPGRQPAHLVDGATNTYWAPRGSSAGEWVEVDLAQPIRLLDIVVHAGVSADQRQFLGQARPREVAVMLTARNGRTVQVRLVLRDQAGAQRFSVKADAVVRVRLTVLSVNGLQPGRVVALGELELFGRR